MSAPKEADGGGSGEDDSIVLPGGLRIPLSELRFEFARGGGPGGQNVNKLNTRATLRFDVAGSPALRPDVRARLLTALKNRITGAGELLIHAGEHRTQPQNRAAALERFRELLTDALAVRKKRHATKPTRGSVERRIAARKRRSQIKKWRREGDD